ncbi:MAG TPA: hypothetical protein PL081_08245, partial [Pseudomonadales bacterium]|nr:hypothetical protein [Pseudomonadales bacterium]HQN41396.1 hypothetical protein [Pseudomonadales bacterium]
HHLDMVGVVGSSPIAPTNQAEVNQICREGPPSWRFFFISKFLLNRRLPRRLPLLSSMLESVRSLLFVDPMVES